MSLIIFVFLVIMMSFLNPYFLTWQNAINILRQASIMGILACGIAYMLIHGSFDLSVGSTLSLCSVSAIVLLREGLGTFAVIALCLMIGIACGFVCGLLVGKLKANSMICTLAMQIFIQGLALMVTGGANATAENIPQSFLFIGKGNIAGIPTPVIIFLLLALIMQIILVKTTFGRKLYAMGINAKATKLSGVKVENYRVLVYMIAGLTAAISGIIVASRVGSSTHYAGLGYEFDVQMCCVLGGISLYGGTGNVFSAVFGAIVFMTINNALTLMAVPPYAQMIVRGLILVFIIALEANTNRRGK